MIANDPPTKPSQPQPKNLITFFSPPPPPDICRSRWGADCGVKSLDDLHGPGVWSIRKNRTWLFRASPLPCPVNDVDQRSQEKQGKKKEHGAKSKKKKKKTCICTLPRVPLSWSRLPSINLPVIHSASPVLVVIPLT